MYDCICFKCGKHYNSESELDTDNFGKCPPCKEAALEIAKKVEANLALIRQNRPVPPKSDYPQGGAGRSGIYLDQGRN